jgi:hypothetical protein
LESSWKGPNSKFLAQEIYSNMHIFNNPIQLTEEGQIPDWLMTGVTIIIPKISNDYRPIIRGAEHEYENENSKLATVSKKSANVFYI